MRIVRKYNLGRIGYKYESVEIEASGENIEQIIKQIDAAWLVYSQAIQKGEVV